MGIQPHVKLKSGIQKEKPVTMRFNYGFGSDENQAKPEPNYELMVKGFRDCMASLKTDIKNRHAQRNEELGIPAHYDYVRIQFQDQFNLIEHKNWSEDFGLTGVYFSKFNREGLFAIVNEKLFQTFVKGIEHYIARESGEKDSAEYPARIRFIRSFQLLNTSKILNYNKCNQLISLQLIDFPIDSSKSEKIRRRLILTSSV